MHLFNLKIFVCSNSCLKFMYRALHCSELRLHILKKVSYFQFVVYLQYTHLLHFCFGRTNTGNAFKNHNKEFTFVRFFMIWGKSTWIVACFLIRFLENKIMNKDKKVLLQEFKNYNKKKRKTNYRGKYKRE